MVEAEAEWKIFLELMRNKKNNFIAVFQSFNLSWWGLGVDVSLGPWRPSWTFKKLQLGREETKPRIISQRIWYSKLLIWKIIFNIIFTFFALILKRIRALR